MHIFVDFDDTICPHGDVDNEPFKMAAEAIRNMRKRGYKITLFSCRANKDVVGQWFNAAVEDMIEYCKKWDIEYDDIYYGKPLYDAIIDDRAIAFHDNWDLINERLGGAKRQI